MARKIRVVIAKPGLDGHDRGAKIIARALRDAGMEVIYTGLHQTPEQIVETAIQEDADAVGISILSGAHMTLVPRILDGLKANGVEDVLVVVGGTIPGDDAEELKEKGVAEVFTPGAPTSEIVDFLRAKIPRQPASGTCPGTVPGRVRLGLDDDAGGGQRAVRAGLCGERHLRRLRPDVTGKPFVSRSSAENASPMGESIPSSDAVSGTDTPTFWPYCLTLRPPATSAPGRG